jgi:hypothetical protein
MNDVIITKCLTPLAEWYTNGAAKRVLVAIFTGSEAEVKADITVLVSTW